jgi:hypothetical protein
VVVGGVGVVVVGGVVACLSITSEVVMHRFIQRERDSDRVETVAQTR